MEGPRTSLEVDDAVLVRRVAGGDADALRVLYERFGRIVYSFAYRFVRDPSLAEECTQDVFLALWRRASTFDPSRAKLSTWLLAVARNRAIELGRQRSRRPLPAAEIVEETEPDELAPDPSSVAVEVDRAERLALALAELPEEQREVVTLAYFDQLSHTEIAELIGIPLGTVKGRMRLAFERLRGVAETHDLQPDT